MGQNSWSNATKHFPSVEGSRGKEFSYAYEYNKKGVLLTKVKLGATGEKIHTFTYNYDEQSNLIKEVYQGIRKVETSFSYSASGEIVKKEVYSNDLLSHTTEYTYNDKQDLIQEVKFNAKALVEEQLRYTYFEKGKIKSIQKFNRTNQLVRKWDYTYNDKWNIDTIKIYDGAKSSPLYMSQYLYKYHSLKK